MFFSNTLFLLSLTAANVHALPTTASSTGTSRSTYAVTLRNNCSSTVWPAGYQTNTQGALLSSANRGATLLPNTEWTANVPLSAMGVQFWARQGCTGSNDVDGGFTCSVGDCKGFACTELNWRGGVGIAEFGAGLGTTQYDTDVTAYDISVIGGNNVGLKVVPSVERCLVKECPVAGCAADQAWSSASQAAQGSPADTICTNQADFTVTFCPS